MVDGVEGVRVGGGSRSCRSIAGGTAGSVWEPGASRRRGEGACRMARVRGFRRSFRCTSRHEWPPDSGV